jgi:cytochrome c oxidase subunit 3
MMENLQMTKQKPFLTEPTQKDKERAKIFMMWLAMFAIFVMFGGFSSFFIVSHENASWQQFDVPKSFSISTYVILASSVTMTLGTLFTRKANRLLATIFIFSTLILGIIFTYLQWEGWKELVSRGLYAVDPRSGSGNNSVSLFYVITGLHVAHVLGGLVALLVTTIRSAANKYTPQNYTGMKLTSLYWHFLDGLWLYLFLFWNYADQIF